MISLRARQLLSASLILAIFIALTGAALEQAYRRSAIEAEHNRLEALIYALLGVAEINDDGRLIIPRDSLPDPRLDRPQSSLQVALTDERGALIWGSRSLADDWSAGSHLQPGLWSFQYNEDFFSLSFGLRWREGNRPPQLYTLQVIQSSVAYQEQLATYRRTLWGWLGGAAFALLLVQWLVLEWGLSPLRQLTSELRHIESGKQTRIESDYPTELRPLTGALNSMIQNERHQQTRYRHSLGDLAHSLKTPLAVLHGALDEPDVPENLRTRLAEPLGTIQRITDYQLRRAALAGRRTLSEPIALRPLADKNVAALGKVYAQKSLRIDVQMADTLKVRADEGDLYEMLGNLLDNACKWARQQIRLEAHSQGATLDITLDDDGAGFPADAQETLGRRGARADSQVPGQGIGLASVRDLVEAYDGSLTLQTSPLGGARVQIQLHTG